MMSIFMKNIRNWWKNMKALFSHIKTILIHKYWVLYYCCKLGIIWRGITHDLSKFHPKELFESVKYYKKGVSPITLCKKDKGYSIAWFHHRGHNDHHYEYWVDNLDNGGVAIKMSYDALLEMIADWLAAGKTYNGKSFTYKDEFIWWENFLKGNPKIHTDSQSMIHTILFNLAQGYLSIDYWRKNYKFYKKTYNAL